MMFLFQAILRYKLNLRDVYLLTAFLSIIGSIVESYNTPLVNSDGAVYLGAARAYLEGGWEAAKSYYPQPLYSVLIASLSNFISISLIYSADIINAILFALVSVSFVDIVARLTKKNKNHYLIVIFSMLFVVLFARFNEMKGDIYRDFGYWAFSLMSISSLVRMGSSKKPALYLVASILFVIISGAFRQEGYVLILAPIVFYAVCWFKYCFLNRNRQKDIIFIAFLIIIFSTVSFYFYEGYHNRLVHIYDEMLHSAIQLEVYFLNKFSQEYALSLVIFTTFVFLVFEMVKFYDISLLLILMLFFLRKNKWFSFSPLTVFFIISLFSPVLWVISFWLLGM